MNNQKLACKPPKQISQSNISNKNFSSTNLKSDKENITSDVFYMNPLLIENLNQEELRMHAILNE